MDECVCSVPHSGTRTLVEHLGHPGSPRGRWLHFDFDDGLLKQHKHLHLHIPMRHPYSVAASWARRGKNPDKLIAAYLSMLRHLSRPHTLHRMELLPVLDGGEDSDRNVITGQWAIDAMIARLTHEVLVPYGEFFKEFYGDLSMQVDNQPNDAA